MTPPARHEKSLESGIRLALGTLPLVAAPVLWAAFHLGAGADLLLMIAAVTAGSIAATDGTGAALGLLGWAVYTGFSQNRYGQLGFARDDLVRLVLLVAVGVLASTASQWHPRAHRSTAPAHRRHDEHPAAAPAGLVVRSHR
ncbi:MAG: hypothetical protein ACXV2I_13480 [Actinomycetes bacterium]